MEAQNQGDSMLLDNTEDLRRLRVQDSSRRVNTQSNNTNGTINGQYLPPTNDRVYQTKGNQDQRSYQPAPATAPNGAING